jgi:hypothetical protein
MEMNTEITLHRWLFIFCFNISNTLSDSVNLVEQKDAKKIQMSWQAEWL